MSCLKSEFVSASCKSLSSTETGTLENAEWELRLDPGVGPVDKHAGLVVQSMRSEEEDEGGVESCGAFKAPPRRLLDTSPKSSLFQAEAFCPEFANELS